MAFLCCKSVKQRAHKFQHHVQMKTNPDSSDTSIVDLRDPAPEIVPATTLSEDGFRSWVKPKHVNKQRKLCRNIPIIHPFGPFRFVWDAFVIIALIYTSIEVPYTLSFGVLLSLSEPAGVIALFIDLFLLCDIVLNFRTAYIDKYDHLHIITSPKMIARKYLSSWFWLDLISSLPLEFIIPIFLQQADDDQKRTISEFVKILRIFRLLRGLKMLRVLRIFKLFKGFGRYVFVREAAMILKCVRCLAAMLITAHYLACFWYLVGWQTRKNGKQSWIQIIEENHGDSASNFTKYSYSWYWAIVTLFTTGYGDIHAYNEEEQWTASVCIIIGTCFFAYFIGILTTLLEEGDRVRMYELERVEEAQLFCAHHRIPRQLARAITTHIRYHCNYNYPFDHQRIMASIPTYLQNHLTNHLAQSLIDLDIFKHLPSSVIGQIALKMTSTSCNSGHTLFKKGELAHEFFIQRTGRSILHRSQSQKTRVLERGDVCGEYAILSGKHRDTVKCITWSEFYVLDINDLVAILRDNYIDSKLFHREFRHIKTVLRKTLQKSTRRKVKFRKNVAESGEFIHEFLGDTTSSTIYLPADDDDSDTTAGEHNKYRPLNPPNQTSVTSLIESTSTKIHNQQLNKMRSNASNTNSSPNVLIKKLSEMLARENSDARHELVIKKPNALSMDIDTLDNEHMHREFEYSDHEDSHFYSDINHNHDIVTQCAHEQRVKYNANSNNNMKMKRKMGGKFGGKKARKSTTNYKQHKIDQIANLLHGLNGNETIKKMNEAVSESVSISMDDDDDETDVDSSATIIIANHQETHTVTDLSEHMKKYSGKTRSRSGTATISERDKQNTHSPNNTGSLPLNVIQSKRELSPISPYVLKRNESITDYRVTPKDIEHIPFHYSNDNLHNIATNSSAFTYAIKDIQSDNDKT